MSADSPRRGRGVGQSVPAVVPPQVVSDRSILDSAIGFINDVTLAHQIHSDPKDTICWARFESMADISDPRFGEDWELEGNVAPPLLLILGYGLGVQVWAIPANGEAVEVLSWRHGSVTALRVLPTPAACNVDTERADELMDAYADKRPLIALCDGGGGCGSKMGAAGGLQPQFCAVNFISLKTSVQVKTIKFKNPVLDILANRTSIVVTFHERIAVFDARTLEDRLSITSCYPSPGINPNPVALGSRWLAYAEHKLLHSKRSGGGCDGEGVASYTATVLNAAKSFGKGLRELGEQVAAGLTGATSSSGSGSNSKSSSFDSNSSGDMRQAGVVTIMDIKYPIKEFSPTSGTPISSSANDPFIAHFIAHSEAVVAMEFDNSGMLLVTADRRGHDFHVFRIQPHPVGSSLAAVHHLYVLHRGDTSAKVQNIAFTLDSRWIAVSTLRGTTHVFPITPYGGPMGVRTHTSLHVVNKLSRFHRSAGLSAEGRSNSPISHSESTTFSQSLMPFHNPTLPPYPRPIVVLPLAQLRQPFALGSPPGSAIPSLKSSSGSSSSSSGSQRQRLTSLSDDNGKPLSVCAIFAKSRSWLLDPPNVTRETLPHRMQRKAVDSLFVMAGHGALIQYDLDTKLASNVAKEKICDETPIELEVEAKAQWNLGRRDGSQDIIPPLSPDNWLIRDRRSCMLIDSTRQLDEADDRAESWLSQVEIITHAGPHRRLWMGPQFVFKTYNTPSGSNLSHIEAEAVEIGISGATSASRAERSSPLNMPLSASGRTSVPVLIESGSYSSIEQSPKLMDRFRHEHLNSDFSVAHGDSRLKEDLADAMRESPSVSKNTATERLLSDAYSGNAPFCDALAADVVNDTFDTRRSAVHALAHALPNIYSYATSSSQQESAESSSTRTTSIEKVVNPLGTVTTIVAGMTTEVSTDILDELVSQLAAEETVIHENCDESLFRPVVAIFCDKTQMDEIKESREQEELMFKPPEFIENKLIVPVIDKERDDELCRKEKQKSGLTRGGGRRGEKVRGNRLAEEDERKFSELAQMSKQRSIQSALKDGCMVRLEGPECKESGSKPKEEVTRASEELQTEKKSCVKNANSSTEKGSEEKASGKVEGRKSIEKAQICEGIERRQEAKTFDPIAMKANRESEKPAERKQEEKAREIKSRNKNSITKQKHEKTTDSWRETQSQEKTEKDQGKTEERTKKKQANQKVEDERCSTAKTEEKDIHLKKNNKDKAKTEEKQDRKGEEDCEEKNGGGVNNDIKGKVFSIEKKQLHTKGNSKEEVDLKSEKTIKSNEEKLREEIYVSTQKESKNKDRELKDKANSIRDKSDKSDKKTTRNEEKKLPSVDINIEEILVSTEKEDLTKKSQVEEDRKECEENKRIEDKSQDSSKKTDEVMENAKEPPVEIINVSPLSLGESEKLTADKAKESANKETAGTCNISLNPKRKTTEKAAKSTEKSAKQDQRREPGEEKEILNQKSQLVVTAKQENNQKHLQEVEKLNKDKETIPDNPATQDESKEGANLGTKFKSNVVELKKSVDAFVEEFPKSAKKKKQRSNKSTSNSESDEVVEVIATTKLAKGKKKNKNPPAESLANIEKKSSTSSEGSFANLADSLLENKAPIEETMYISFSKIMEKQKVVDTTDSTEAAKEQLSETKNSEENSTTSECNTEESIKAEVKASSRANLDGINPVEELQSGEDKFVGKFVKDERKDTQKTEEDTVVKNRTQSAKSDSKANKNKSKSVAKTKFDKSKEKEQIDQLKQTEDGKPVTPIEKEEKEADRKPREMESKNKNKAEVDSTIKTNKIASDSKENQNRECTGTVKKQISRKEYKEHTKNLDSAKSRETIGSLESVEEIIKETEMEEIKETNDVIAKKAVGDTTGVLKDESLKPIIFVEESKKSKKSKSENKPIEDEITPCTIITEQPRRKKVETPKEEWVSTTVNKAGSHTSNISGTTVTDPKKCEKSKNREKLNTEAPFSEDSDMKNGEPAQETLVSSDKWSTEHKKSTEQYKSTDPSPKPPVSVWNTLSGADMINQQLMSVTKAVAGIVSQKKNTTTIKGEKDIKKSDLTEASPLNIPGETSIIFAKADKKSKKSLPTTNFQDFSILKTLDPLPPLPVLEPLEISTTVDPTKACTTAHSESPVSLINLESPQPENPSSEIKITPPPRGFTQQNIIFALCGSLHYENESRNTLSRSNSLTVGGKSTVNYKSLIENINDEQYLSLEPSNQEQPDSTSSSNSSVSEEVQEIVMESKKLGKKKRHKKTELESTKQKEKQKKERCAEDDDDNADEDHGEDADDDDDEELQPLISLSESINLDVFDVSNETTFVSRVSSHSAKGDTTSNTSGTGGGGGGTTDSEGPMAATTTSDDNNYYGYRTSNTSHTTTTGIKMKTKKLEHKINLIAAIEAATSCSSTSSAEESGVEGGGSGGICGALPSTDNAVASMSTSNIATATMSNIQYPSTATTAAGQQGAAKKKTKRRKR